MRHLAVEADSLKAEIAEKKRESLRVIAGRGEDEDGLAGELVHDVTEVAVLVLGGDEEVLLSGEGSEPRSEAMS